MAGQKQGKELRAGTITEQAARGLLINFILGIVMMIAAVAMLTIGIFFGTGRWQAGDPTARWLLLGTGVGGAAYIFVRFYKAVRR